MLTAFDFQTIPSGTGYAAQTNYKERTHYVDKTADPFGDFDMSGTLDLSNFPRYDWDSLQRAAEEKVEKLTPLLQERFKTALVNGYDMVQNRPILETVVQLLPPFALDPTFKALSVNFLSNGDVELIRVTEDKADIDYLTVTVDDETGLPIAMLSRFEGGRSIHNVLTTIDKVVPHIVGSLTD